MNILLVGRNAHIGGGSTFRLNIGRGLLSRGHRVEIAALGGPMVERYREAGLEFHWTPPWSVCAGRLARLIRHRKIDLVHASNTTAGDLAREACRKTGTPLVVSLHNTISNEEAQHPCLKEARRIIVFDAGARASAAKFSDQFEPEKIVRVPRPVVHRPIDPDRVSPIQAAYVARLSSRKGRVALNLLQAFEAMVEDVPNASLLILGDGSQRKHVEAEAARINGKNGCRVEVCGRVLDPASRLAGAGIVIGAGYSALEAVMQGRAVIGAGFKGYGLVTESNVFDAIECNFGDTVGKWDMTPANFQEAWRRLRSAWRTPATRGDLWGLDRIVAPVHGVDAVAERLEALYQETLTAV